MFILGLGTAVPPHRYRQSECWEALQNAPQFARLSARSRAILKKALQNSSIASRHLALDPLAEAFALSPDILHVRFASQAPILATRAAEAAMAKAVVPKEEIDALLISTCTGYLCPGLTSYVSERLGLASSTLCLDLVGQGCGAAIPNLRVAEALLGSGRAGKALSICVEVCSAAFYLDDDPGVLISACLFGDGAAAAVVGQTPGAGTRRVEWLEAISLMDSGGRDCLKFEQRNGMLRNILTKPVPGIAAKHAKEILNATLARRKLSTREIAAWIFHPGGRDVLAALAESLALSEADLAGSAAVLREFGNMSSPSVLFVLQAAFEGGASSGYWWISSFGAGFSCHGALLRVE